MINIITCFWNVEDYIEKCIDSIKNQTFKEFRIFLVDDVSTDSTVDKIKKLIDGDSRFTLISNVEKKFKLRNMDELFRDENLFNDEDIIVELDGDDWFYDENVLDFINSKYESNKKLWLTNGSWVWTNGQFGFSSKANPDTVRTDPFQFSHLRTWKIHLWRNINKESLQYDDGTYFKSGADVAYAFPMVEMSGTEHYEYIPNILLVYNGENPRNDHKSGSAAGGSHEQFRVHQIITSRPKYKKL
jgi:glycosyltransferase involved in cell wall biosynthesis